MELCGKMIKKPGMSEARPCIRIARHTGGYDEGHRPDLTGMKNVFGCVKILRRGPDYIRPLTGHKHIQWILLDKYGKEHLIPATRLFQVNNKGIYGKCGKVRPELSTVKIHYERIFKSKKRGDASYKNMLFFNGWNPDEGGSLKTGMHWILDNLGPKLSMEYQLHVIKSRKYPYGFFGPRGIVWRNKMDRHDQDLLDLVCDWTNKKFDSFVKNEYNRRKSKSG